VIFLDIFCTNMIIEESNVECIYKTAAILAPSLGPCGMDKLLVDDKGNILDYISINACDYISINACDYISINACYYII
jgi:hypothetical protein